MGEDRLTRRENIDYGFIVIYFYKLIKRNHMRIKLALGLIVSLVALRSVSLPAFGQPRSKRYPTDLELNRLFTRFRQLAQWHENDKVGAGYVRDRRTPAQREALQSFVKDWSLVESASALFFGSWQGYEDGITIYPSKTKNRVCIIRTGEGRGRFYLGTASKGRIYTNDFAVLFKQGRYLGEAVVINGKPSLNGNTPHNSPRPLERPEQFIQDRVLDARVRSEILQQYENAGCITSLPASSQLIEGRSPQNTDRQFAPRCFRMTGNDWMSISTAPNTSSQTQSRFAMTYGDTALVGARKGDFLFVSQYENVNFKVDPSSTRNQSPPGTPNPRRGWIKLWGGEGDEYLPAETCRRLYKNATGQ
jgi:hypothetical protein